MLVAGSGIKVVPTALHVTVMRVEQAPRIVIAGIRSDEGGNCRWRCLECLANPVCLDQDLGSRIDQCPPGLNRWNHVGPESGQAIPGQLKQCRGRRLDQFAFHIHQQGSLDA